MNVALLTSFEISVAVFIILCLLIREEFFETLSNKAYFFFVVAVVLTICSICSHLFYGVIKLTGIL